MKIEVISMLNQAERELLIKTYEKTHNAKLTAEIFGVHERTVYEKQQNCERISVAARD